MTSLPEILQSDDALQRVVSFARHYGEAHISLAMHAALPLGLTPDLLHLVRINFVNSAPWIAEADLLLSPLCREVGGELYEMVPEVRDLLLDELRDDPEFGSIRVREVAEFLVEYSLRALKEAAQSVSPEMRDFFKAQEWVGMAYARPEEAARALASALREELQANNRGEVIRIAGLTQVLTAPLLSEQKMLLYAAGLKKVAAGENAGARSLFEALGPLDQTANIGGVELPAPSSLLPTQKPIVSEVQSPSEAREPAVAPERHHARRTQSAEEDWNELLDSIKNGDCTPIIGPGASYGILPSSRDIAAQWAKEYQYPFMDTSDLPSVAQYMSVMTESLAPKEELRKLLNRSRQPDFGDPGNIYRVLAGLPLPIYLSLTYDDFMSQALTRVPKDHRSDLCEWNRYLKRRESALQTGFVPSAANPLVFKFYGTAEVPESLVLTEDDYLDFIFNVARERVIPPRIERALTSTKLLFLGTGFNDISLRVLFRFLHRFLHRYQRVGLNWTSFIQLSPWQDDKRGEQLRSYATNYFKQNSLRIYWGTVEEFSRELNERWLEFESAHDN